MRLRTALASVLVVAVAAGLGSVIPAVAAGEGVSVSGVVTAPVTAGGSTTMGGASNVRVTLMPLVDAAVEPDSVLYNRTFSAGNFKIEGVPPGQYRVFFDPSWSLGGSRYAAEWLGGSYYELRSSILTVGTTAITDVNAELELGATVSGSVTFSGGATGPAAAKAFLQDPETGLPERHGSLRAVVSGDTYMLAGLAPGRHIIRFSDAYDIDQRLETRYYDDATYIWELTSLTVEVGESVTGIDGTLGPAPSIDVYRIGGANRYDVSAELASFYDPDTTDEAFVVSGRNFPDALSAGPAAALLGVPVLLVGATGISQSVAEALEDLTLDRIYVIGGTASVSASIVSQLGSHATTVERIAGSNRYEVSRNVARTFWPETEGAYMATGRDFPDALAAGPAAALFHYPILLEDGEATTVPAETISLINDLGISRITIAGGATSFTESLEASLVTDAGVPEVHRGAGANRYLAAREINTIFPMADTVFLATGANFPDALAGAALAGATASPLYLARSNCIPREVFDSLDAKYPAQIFLLGGPATLNNTVAQLNTCT